MSRIPRKLTMLALAALLALSSVACGGGDSEGEDSGGGTGSGSEATSETSS